MPSDTKKSLSEQFEILVKIYTLYDAVIETLDLACKVGCDLCCTRNVTVTSLEACLIADRLEKTGRKQLFEKIESAESLERFHPQTTTNTLAWLCKNGKNPPEEEFDPAWRPCPLLSESKCLIYGERPFGCRCMVSKTACRQDGYAEMEDYLLSINTVFMQFVEHADTSGSSGNFIDMLLFMSSADQRRAYKNDGCTGRHRGFVANRPIEMIMLPPEYQLEARPVLNKLQALFSKQSR